MASQHEESSESDGETEPAKCFHRRLSTNKDIRYNTSIKEGFLSKQNGSFQRWHKRYFKLKSGVLYYSKHEKSTIFNQIDLIDSSIAERSLKNINHSFQVITPFRNLVLCAETRREMRDWVTAIRSAASKDFQEMTSEMAELSSLSDHHNWCVLPNIRPIFCNVCAESLQKVSRAGVTINGLACEVCKFRTHKKCASRSPPTCKWTTLASMGGNIMEDEEGNLSMPHQWLMGNFPVSSKCLICEKPCGSMLRLQDYWCLWCHCTVHTSCKEQTTWCNLGPARVSILPPTSITNFNEGGFWRASKSPSTSPLLVFLNSKSGDSQGVKMLRRFKQLLNPAQVFDLMNGGPKMGLRLFQNFESFRVLVCGGDGSVGWCLNEIDRLGLHKQCQVGVLPLGTGNDLSRVLGWGATFDDDTQLPSLLEKLEHAQIQMFDRWSIFSYETDQTRNTSLPIDPIGAYEDTAANHLSRILHSDSHNVVISSAMVLCSIVQELVSKVGSSIEDSEGCSSDRDSVAHKCLTLNEKMEALLKTLAEESTIGVSTTESERIEDSTFERNIRSGSSPTPSSSPLPPSSSPILLEPPAALSPQKRVHISPARALFLAPFSSSSVLSLSFPSLMVSTGSLQQTENVVVVSPPSTLLSPHHAPVFTTTTNLTIQSPSLTSQPPYSSSSFLRASAISHHTCLTDYQFRGLSPLLHSPQTLSPSVSPSPSSNLRQSPQPPSSHPPPPLSSFPAFESPKFLPPSSANEVCFDGGALHLPHHVPAGPPITRKHLAAPGRGIAFQRTTNKEVVRSREQLMCRANSLKKAIRQIVELTEKAVDEQNHQTTKFDHDNQRKLDESVITMHTTSTIAATASENKPTEESMPAQVTFFDIPKVIIKTPSHGSMESGTASVRGSSLDYTSNSTELEAQSDLPLSSVSDITTAIAFPTAIITSTTSAFFVDTVVHTFSVSPFSFTAEDSVTTDAATINCSDQPIPLTPRSPTSRAITPVTFNYQLCDLSAPSSSYTTSQSTFSTSLMSAVPAVPWSTEYFRTSPAWLTHQRSPVRGSSGATEGFNLTSDIPAVSIVDDSILDDEVSEVMRLKMRHEASIYGGDHLAVPAPDGANRDPHHHIPHSSYLSPSHHYHFYQKRSSSPYHHHAYHPYSSSNSDASCCSTPGRLTPQAFQQLSGLPSLVDRWSPLFGMSAGRTNSPLPSFFDKPSEARVPPTDPKALPVDQSLLGACLSHVGNGRHISSLSAMTRDKEVMVAQNGARHSLKGGEGVQFPLLNIPLLQSLPKQVIGKGRKSSPIHSSIISRVLLANADALCAPASPLNDLENINLDDFTEKCVMNNYFGIGLDAKIALDFHNKREEHPQKCRSRTKNMMWYGVLGGKEILQRTYKNLDQRVRLECDGRLIPLPNLQGIVILNIPSYMGGTNFWGGSKEDEYFIAPSFDDKVLEVVAVFGSIQLGISRVINIQRHRIAQCRTVRITIIGDEGLPVQVDGEAWIQNPGVILIQHKNRAQVLIRDRAFEEALKNWAEKQKLDRTLTREPLLSESEVATVTSCVDASHDLFENVKVVALTFPEVDLSTPVQAVKFIENIKIKSTSSDGKSVAKTSRGEVMEFANSMRSYIVDLKSTWNEKNFSEILQTDIIVPLRSSLETTEVLVDKVHSIGAHFYESSSLQRGRNRDRLKSLFKLPKSSKRHKGVGKETSKPDVLSIRDWSNAEIALWLNSLDLPEYAEAFVAHDIRGAELLTLGRTDLKELGVVKVGHLKRIIQEIKSIKESLKMYEGSKIVSEESSTSPLLQQQQQP